jgi:hypothetical protein
MAVNTLKLVYTIVSVFVLHPCLITRSFMPYPQVVAEHMKEAAKILMFK